jgi:hypothetical protein
MIARLQQTDYRARWELLKGDLAKMHYLVMLKERAQLQQDAHAHAALLELTARWLQEPYVQS